MARDDQYDSFYRATRRDLLLQTFALTGDLPAAQSAVRDAYVGAWQHWRKVSRLDDPLDWVRPRAWQLAQRRHTARIWHRNKGLSEEHRAVLDALTSLTAAQRRVLLLVTIGEVDVAHAGRELGVTQEVAERSLARATTAFAHDLGVQEEQVTPQLASLSTLLDRATLPRGPIVRRAGRKRRNGHAVVGAVTAVLVALAAGALAYEPGVSSAQGLKILEPPIDTPPAEAGQRPTAGNLLDADQIRRLGPAQRWTVTSTDDNTSGKGINTVCQQSRFADPDGYAAIVRRFAAVGSPHRTAVQTVEISKSARAAAAGFRTTVGWFAGCRVGRLQLLSSYRVDNIGDEADVLMVRLWHKPVTTMSVAVARTGVVTTSTVATHVGAAPPPPSQITQSLADSVAMLCARSRSHECAKKPTYRVVPPPPSGEEAGILAVADLPPVGRIDQPWVGTTPTAARANPSATTCDRANFVAGGATRTRTRTYLIPQAKLPTRFGLSETYGVFGSSRAAARFLAGVRTEVAGCEKRDLSTTVSNAHTEEHRRPALDLSSWDLATDVSQHRKVGFRLGFVRVGDTVAEVTFAPTRSNDMTAAAFHMLLVRTADRLRELR